MEKPLILGLLLVAALFVTPAFAAQNAANTSQKGSLLIFPLVDVRPENTTTTIIDISNDQNLGVFLNCYYVNGMKDRNDFSFPISGKGSVSWDVLTHSGSIAPPPFPSGGTFLGVGELICFAVDAAGANQVRFNHLTGTATVVTFKDSDAVQNKQAFKYDAWAFTARSTLTPPPPDGTPVGTAGDLVLSGGGDGTYDACPAILIANFSPSGAKLGGATFIDNDLSVSGCNQDLRQDFLPNLTKLKFVVWNEAETAFTGAFQCANSVDALGLDPSDSVGLVHPENFTFGVLRTNNARFQVQGVASTQCAGSQNVGLVGLLSTSIGIGGTAGMEAEDEEIGNTIQGAGTETGFVRWDPAPAIVPEKPRQR